jgi:SAM-dependent methyltransferase
MTHPDWKTYAWDQHPVFASTVRLIDRLFPNGSEGVTLVDLGCLEGGFSIEFARRGFDVLGIEVRPSNAAACRARAATLDLPNLRFAEDDAWNLPKYGTFDVVFCSGLLYHLDRPRAFLEMIGRQTKHMLLLNTHVAPYDPIDVFDLGDLEVHEGLLGRWYCEFATEEEFTRRDEVPLSSGARASEMPCGSTDPAPMTGVS